MAEACATGAWEGLEVGEVALADWLDYLDVLDGEDALVGVMMRPDGDHLQVEPLRHREDLASFTEEPDL